MHAPHLRRRVHRRRCRAPPTPSAAGCAARCVREDIGDARGPARRAGRAARASTGSSSPSRRRRRPGATCSPAAGRRAGGLRRRARATPWSTWPSRYARPRRPAPTRPRGRTPGPDERGRRARAARRRGHNLHPCGRTRLGWDTADVLAHDLEAGAHRGRVRRRPPATCTRRRPRRRAAAAYPSCPRAARLPAAAGARLAARRRPAPTRYADLFAAGALRDRSTRDAAGRADRRAAHPAAAARRDGLRRYLKVSLDIQVTSTRRTHLASPAPATARRCPRCCTGCSPTTRTATGCCCWPRPPAPPCRPAPAATCRAIVRDGLTGRLGARRDRGARRRAAGDRPATGRHASLAELRRPPTPGAALASSPSTPGCCCRRCCGWPPGTASRWRRTCRTACRRSSAAAAPAGRSATSPACGCTCPGWPPPGTGCALWPGSVVGTDDVDVMRAKIGYTALQAHLGELVVRLGRLARPGRGRRLAGGARRSSTRRTTALRADPARRAPRPRRSDRAEGAAQGAGPDAAGRRRRPLRAGAEPAACVRLSRGRRPPLRRRRAAPVCAYVYDTGGAARRGPPRVRAALPAGATAAVRGEGQRPPGVRRRPGRRRATAWRSPPAASWPWPVAAGAARGSCSAGRPRPTPSWPPRWPPARWSTWRARTSCAGSPRRGAAGRPVRAAGEPGRRRAARQPHDDRRADPVRHRRGAAARGGRAGRAARHVRVDRLPPARGVQQPGRRRARRVRRRRAGLVGRDGRPARRRPARTSTSAAGSASTTPATPRFDLAALRRLLRRPPTASSWSSSRAGCLAADAGWYAAEVLDLKRTHGRWFAVLRGGTHHFRLPAAWGYSHPFTVLPVDDWPYPFARPEVARRRRSTRSASCARPRDVLARGQRVDRLRVGDVLVFARRRRVRLGHLPPRLPAPPAPAGRVLVGREPASARRDAAARPSVSGRATGTARSARPSGRCSGPPRDAQLRATG